MTCISKWALAPLRKNQTNRRTGGGRNGTRAPERLTLQQTMAQSFAQTLCHAKGQPYASAEAFCGDWWATLSTWYIGSSPVDDTRLPTYLQQRRIEVRLLIANDFAYESPTGSLFETVHFETQDGPISTLVPSNAWRSGKRSITRMQHGQRFQIPGPYLALLVSRDDSPEQIVRCALIPIVLIQSAHGIQLYGVDSHRERRDIPKILRVLPSDVFVWKPQRHELVTVIRDFRARHPDQFLDEALDDLVDYLSRHKTSRPDLVVIIPGVGVVVFEIFGIRGDEEYDRRSDLKIRDLRKIERGRLHFIGVDYRAGGDPLPAAIARLQAIVAAGRMGFAA